jgi:hypothetical protein
MSLKRKTVDSTTSQQKFLLCSSMQNMFLENLQTENFIFLPCFKHLFRFHFSLCSTVSSEVKTELCSGF